ncbi:hypothetical protein [Paracoccus alkanivorans]|nr:hypothetical protein [Paracoccus alkanivorans]
MNAILAGLVAMIGIGIGAWLILDEAGFSSQEVYSGPNVRLEQPAD